MTRIALNALYVGGGVAGGKVYRDGLLQGLAALDGIGDIEFDLFTRRPSDLPDELLPRVRVIEAPIAQGSTFGRTAWEYAILPRVLRRGGYSACHALGSLSPRLRDTPLVLTLHDLIYRRFPESVPWGYRTFMHAVQPRIARESERVIVPSRYVAQEVMEQLDVREDRVRVVYEGAGQNFRPVENAEQIDSVRQRYAIRTPYIIAVARGYPHKNIAGLLRAFDLLRHEHPDVALVLVGDRYRAGASLELLARELSLTSAVIWTGFVSMSELRALYSGAVAFAFPSLSEGFGLPPLEAMACGTPVVASNRTAIPEVVGDAGLLVDATDAEEFAAALGRVVGDGNLRANLKDRGQARAATFTWRRCAAETVDVYRELL